jgi:superfamily II DNA or RNA helicase
MAKTLIGKKDERSQIVLDKLKSKLGPNYEFPDFNYENMNVPITIKCLIHNRLQNTPPANILNKDVKCRVCAESESRERKKLEMSKQFFEVSVPEIQKTRPHLSFEKFKYEGNKTKSIVTCKFHGDKEMTVLSLVTGGSDCIECAQIKKTNGQTYSYEDYVKVFKEKHGESYNPPSKEDYVDYNSDTYITCKEHGKIPVNARRSIYNSVPCPLCGKGWSKKTLLHFINSLQNELTYLDPIELITIINSNNLAQRLERMGRLSNLISTRAGSQERQEIVNEILNIIENSNEENINDVQDNQINTVQDVLTQEQVDAIVSTQEQEEELPRVNVIEEMRAYDNNMLTASLDDENVDFLLKNGLKKIWVEVLTNRLDVNQYREENGGENFNIIKGWFFNEYDEAMSLPLPKDYHFKDNKGNINKPNLMQRLIALRTIRDKSYGNWSDTGTGKTLAGLLTGRIHSERNNSNYTTLIICNNATVEGWKKSINEYFAWNNIYTKTTMTELNMNDISVIRGGTNYIIVNYEKFQQKDSENFVYHLVHDQNIGYVILDEVHNIKQREQENESIRRNNVIKLTTALREVNPNVMLSAMSATPIINNFYEPKAIIELLTGEVHKEIETTENIQNGIELYKLLTRHGLRYRGIKFVKEKLDTRRINGNHLINDFSKLSPGDLLRTEQILLNDKLDNIKNDIKKGTLIYTHYITGLKNKIGEYVKNLGFTIGYYTGGDKEGLELFKQGKIDVLIGSAPVSTGVDGIQKVCDRMILLTLPWTNADYLQLKGRVIDRTGCIFEKVDVIIPQVFIESSDGVMIYDEINRLERIKYKGSLMDLVLDGTPPIGKLPPKNELLKKALIQLGVWKERIENGNILTIQREELKVPLNPQVVETLQKKLGDFSEMNRVWSVSNSTTTAERLSQNPEEWYQYHTLYKEKRQEWNEIPYEVIGKKISSRPDWVVGDFGCGENLLSKEITNKVHSFDHIAIDDNVIACDISNVPLKDGILDVAVFSLSLMGSNHKEYLEEGHRTLRPFGLIMICEPKSKWEDNPNKLVDILKEIGFTANIERITDRFIYVVGTKI